MKIYIESDIVQLSKCNWSMSTIKDFSENFSVLMTIEINFRVLFEITSNDSIEIIPRIDSKTYDILHLSNQMHAWDGKNISFFICECSLFIESTYFNLASFSCVAWCTFTRESTDMVVALSIIQARIWLAFVVFIIAQFTGETWNEVKYSHKMKFKIHFECENCVFFFWVKFVSINSRRDETFLWIEYSFLFFNSTKKGKIVNYEKRKKKTYNQNGIERFAIFMEYYVTWTWTIERQSKYDDGRSFVSIFRQYFSPFIFHPLDVRVPEDMNVRPYSIYSVDKAFTCFGLKPSKLRKNLVHVHSEIWKTLKQPKFICTGGSSNRPIFGFIYKFNSICPSEFKCNFDEFIWIFFFVIC